ncbi:MAG: molybdenum cofactor biosynthesis protein MoaE [Gammaproteobacteria bacterium]|nr:molybdenum cofactor biosynthesis protein MoaE [Gammaproteobacteria bacterium]
MVEISILAQPFDPEAEQRDFRGGNSRVGAVVSFLGLMRDLNQGEAIQRMSLEHYPGMTEKALAQIIAEARQLWPITAVRLIHRVGELEPEEPIVLVLVASEHRGEAFRACEFLIDYLKTRAPFWKREINTQGQAHWVEGRQSDQTAAERWELGWDLDRLVCK